jgi:hypothetical protein
MQRTSPSRAWSVAAGRGSQRGQALIYGLFVLVGGLAGLFFLFNTGQLAREKTKLVNTTDAVAYSGGVMNARALNFQAYTNRAMMANTVAIAQLVSLSSWVQYAGNLGTFGSPILTPEIYKYPLFFPSLTAAETIGPTLQSSLNDTGALEALARGSDNIIRNVLMNAQVTAHAGLLPARLQVMNEVATANYRNDGAVVVDSVPLTVNEYTNFVTRYSDDQRTRFAEVSRISANKDSFVDRRSWRLPAILPGSCATAFFQGRPDWLSRRGGTDLIGFNEWRALDSLSDWRWVPKNKTDVLCRGLRENPAGWGGTSAADNTSPGALDPQLYDAAIPINPSSAGLGLVTTASWDYSGLPNFYDLSSDALSQADPRMLMAIRVRRDKNQTQTSEARSEIKSSARLNAYQAQMAGGSEMAAVSASEVFFQRDGDIRDNSYGLSIGKPKEIGSLFNPYWQVRLVQSDTDVRKAQLLQGVALP